MHSFQVSIEYLQKLTMNQVIVQRTLYKVLKIDITETGFLNVLQLGYKQEKITLKIYLETNFIFKLCRD